MIYPLNINELSFFLFLLLFFVYILFRKFATLQRVAEERTGDHIYKLHYHMQPLSSGIAEDSEDSTIAMAAQSMCGEIISEEVFSIFHGRNRKSLPLL